MFEIKSTSLLFIGGDALSVSITKSNKCSFQVYSTAEKAATLTILFELLEQSNGKRKLDSVYLFEVVGKMFQLGLLKILD